MKKHLVMFDVDGTLVRSLDLEAELFPRACEQALGIDSVSSDWSEYKVPSDRGIVTELVERSKNRSVTEADFQSVETAFFNLLKAAFKATPNLCQEVPGANKMLRSIQRLPNTVLAIATAGWEATARLKLQAAGIKLDAVPFGSANDGLSKEDIMRVSEKRSATQFQVSGFQPRTYVGDSPTDAQASKSLGYSFIRIGADRQATPCHDTFEDYSNLESFLLCIEECQYRSRLA